MSVTFYVEGERPDWQRGGSFLSLSNANARDLLDRLGYREMALWGEISARDLAARCRRRLWDIGRNHGPALAEGLEGNAVALGHPTDYLRERSARLLRLAERAGSRSIQFD